MLRKRKSEHKGSIRESFHSRKFIGGAYATAISALAIIIVLVINLIVSQLNITFDLTADKKYTLSEATITMLKEIEEPITIYYMAQTGTEIEEFTKIMDHYDDYNNLIKVVYKDPIQYPKFASQYVDEDITESSVIVVNEANNRAKYIDYSEMLLSTMDYSTYQYTTTGIDVEGRIDAAIQYVSNENLPKVYAVTGHGEQGISPTMEEVLNKENIDTETINTITAEAIPTDCDVLFLNLPQSDYSEEEVTLIKEYLAGGGKAMIGVNYLSPDLANFNALVEYYGVSIVPGIVIENDTGYYRGNYQNELVPEVKTHEITEGIAGQKYVVSPVSSGLMDKEEKRDSLTITSLLSTSNRSYSKVDLNSQTVSKEEGDIEGPFSLALEVVETYDDIETKVVFFSGAYVFDDTYLATSVFGNVELLLHTINTLAEQENAILVPTISFDAEMLTLTSAEKNRNATIITVIIPVFIILIGITVTLKRRKR